MKKLSMSLVVLLFLLSGLPTYAAVDTNMGFPVTLSVFIPCAVRGAGEVGDKMDRGKLARVDQPGSAASAFPIVGIGASAGGLQALTSLLEALPVDTGLAFVVVQ